MPSSGAYKETVKATGLYGGSQFFFVLISLVRTKFVAILLGTGGVGLNGLFQTPLSVIGSVTGLGIGFSGVRDVASANAEGDEKTISRTIITIKRWAWVTGLLGLIFVMALSPVLSKWTAKEAENQGNYNYTLAFLFLSVTLFFSAINGGQTAILRGTRRIKDTVKTNLFSTFFGLIVSVPLYYFYGIRGIVPAIIASSLVALLLSWYYTKNIKLVPVDISFKESLVQGKGIIKLGVVFTLSNLIMQATGYLIILYLNHQSGTAIVGLYQTGWAMTSQYVGIIFTSISADYFPRMVGVQHDKEKMTEMVNHQTEIAILIIAPLITIYLSFLPLIVRLLASSDFLPIVVFAQWMILGMMFKAVSWALSFIILAKGNNSLFFWSESISCIVSLLLTLIGYHLRGLEGIGIAFVVQYLFYLTAMVYIAYKKYQIFFYKDFIKMFVFQLILCLFCFLFAYVGGYPIAYFVCPVFFIVSALYSWKKLNEKLDLKEIILSKLKKK
jgi:O-antigen/teichoic acid export membrane protein